MSNISAISTSTLLSSISSETDTSTDSTNNSSATSTTATSTSTSSSSTSSAYSLDITPALIKSAISNTYDTQLINSLDVDSTTSDMVNYDFYNHLPSSSLNYVISSNNDSDTTTDTSSKISSLLDISV